ncbi:MFS transporter, SHS family, lactate transporter [[Enterobacter] aerogenes]|nr:MFS transporter, SHS family, lactate transporter [[Enterobacter] aerogenes] [Klebsiella aerogenes]
MQLAPHVLSASCYISRPLCQDRDNTMLGWTSLQRNAAIASFLSWTLDAFDFFLLVFLLSDIAQTFHVGLEKVTLAILLTLAVRPIGALIFGRLAEKYGRKPILMLNIIFFSIFELLSAAAPSLTIFLVLRVLYGVAMGGIWGVASSLSMETIPDRSRGLMSGIFQAGYPFGYLIAAVAYGLLFELLGWRGMFVIGAAPILLLPFIWFCVQESPVWLASRERKESTALLPVLKTHWKLCCYLVVLMAAFNFFSHGTQDLYPVFLKVQHGFEPKTISIIAVTYNIASIIGGVLFGSLSEKIGRKKAIITASLLALPVIPLWAFASGSLMLGIGAFLMQFMVQGAWGVVPTYLNELVPANTRAVLPGFVYQLGNLIASVNATLQATIAEHHGQNYGLAMAIVAGTVAIIIAILTFFGHESRAKKISGAVEQNAMQHVSR